MQVACWGWLRQNAAQGEVRRICFDCEGQVWLEVLQDRSRREGVLES